MSLTPFRRAGESLFNRLKIKDLGSSTEEIRRWLDSDFGRYLLRHERRVLREKFPQLPGYRMLRLGLSDDIETLDSFNQIHRFSLHPSELNASHAALSSYMELPLMSATIDVMLLHHAIEFSTSPKAVLAEASRVVMPGGSLLLCLFNPCGPMGIAKYPMQLCSKQAQFSFHNLRMARVIDWLSLLNFHVVQIEHGAYHLPLNSPGLAERDSRWERLCQKIRFPLGNFYMIHAVKRVPRGITGPASPWRAAAKNGYGVSNGIKRAIHKNIDSETNKLKGRP